MDIKDCVEELLKDNENLSISEFADKVYDVLRKNKVNYGKENILSIFMDDKKTTDDIKSDIVSYRAADVLGLADEQYEKDESYTKRAKDINENPFYFYSKDQKAPLDIENIYDDFGKLYKQKNLIPDFCYENRTLTIRKGNPKHNNTSRKGMNNTEFTILLIYEKIDQLIDDKCIVLDRKSNISLKKALATLMLVGAYCDKHGVDGFDQILDYYSPIIESQISDKDRMKETGYEIVSEANDIANFYAINIDNEGAVIDRKFFENNLYDLKLIKELEKRVAQTSDANINVSGYSKSGKNIKFVNSDGLLESVVVSNVDSEINENVDKYSMEFLAGKIFKLDRSLFSEIQDKSEQARQILLMNAMTVAYQPIEEEDKKKLFQAYIIPYIQLPGSDITKDLKTCTNILVSKEKDSTDIGLVKGLPRPSIESDLSSPEQIAKQNSDSNIQPQATSETITSVRAIAKNAVIEEKKILKWMRKELVKICFQKVKGSYRKSGQSLAEIAERKATLGYLLKNEGKVKGKKTLQEAKFDDSIIDMYNSVESFMSKTVEDLLKEYPNGTEIPEDEMKDVKKRIKEESKKEVAERVKC